jgi:lysophospholipase L1-like esterase
MYERLLLPVAILQGLWLLYRTPTLPAPVGDSGRVGPSFVPALKLAGVGDSIMVGTGVREQCHSLTATYARLLHGQLGCAVDWSVHGRNGATSAQVLRGVLPTVQRAHVYIVSCGVNDATHKVPVEEFARNLAAILDELRARSPRAAILYGGLPPLETFPALPWPLKAVLAERVRQMRAAAAEVIGRHRRVFHFQFPPAMSPEHFASDGFHPHEQSCEQWASGLLALWPPTLEVGRRRPVAGRRVERRSVLASGGGGQMLPVVEPRRD